MQDDVATGLALLDLAHENAQLRGVLVRLLRAVDDHGFYSPDAETEALRVTAHEVLQRFGAEPVTEPTSPTHRPP